jgi:putative SOS response-associated peptidase YedK
MCGRYRLVITTDQLTMRFKVDEVAANVDPNAEIFPSEPIPTISDHEGVRRLDTMKWGFVPRVALFQPAFRQRRCLIPADGFFEWKTIPGQKKQRVCFSLANEDIFGFAGIWEPWTTPSGETVPTVAILTCTPNSLVSEVHSRMPAILHPGDEDEWLNGNPNSASLAALLRPYPADLMHARPIDEPARDTPPKANETLSLF